MQLLKSLDKNTHHRGPTGPLEVVNFLVIWVPPESALSSRSRGFFFRITKPGAPFVSLLLRVRLAKRQPSLRFASHSTKPGPPRTVRPPWATAHRCTPKSRPASSGFPPALKGALLMLTTLRAPQRYPRLPQNDAASRWPMILRIRPRHELRPINAPTTVQSFCPVPGKAYRMSLPPEKAKRIIIIFF